MSEGLSWEYWPNELSDQAREALDQVRAGRPDLALDVIDELISDLGARRQILADMVNRRFEPSTDDRYVEREG